VPCTACLRVVPCAHTGACEVALASLTRGEIAWGCAILAALRDHIWSTEEPKSTEGPKSTQWMLPNILQLLAELTTSTSTITL